MSTDRTARFPRSVRLKTPGQFREVLTQGRRISAALFRLHLRLDVQPDGSAESPVPSPSARLGITVSKRVSPLAVQRNRIKRVVRDSFRQLRTRLPPGDYVVQAQRDAAGATPAALRAALALLWQRAGALKPEPAAPTMPARAGSGDESP